MQSVPWRGCSFGPTVLRPCIPPQPGLCQESKLCPVLCLDFDSSCRAEEGVSATRTVRHPRRLPTSSAAAASGASELVAEALSPWRDLTSSTRCRGDGVPSTGRWLSAAGGLAAAVGLCARVTVALQLSESKPDLILHVNARLLAEGGSEH